MKTGSAADDTYTPMLWYYDLLTFLEDQSTPRSSVDTMSSDDSQNSREEEVEREEERMGEQQDPPTFASRTENSFAQEPVPKQPRNKGSSSNEDELLKREVLQHINKHFKQPKLPEDRFDVFGKNVAMKLRDLTRQQRVIAEKLINDALSEAEMNNLNVTHRITSFTQSTYTYPPTFSNIHQQVNPPIEHSFFHLFHKPLGTQYTGSTS